VVINKFRINQQIRAEQVRVIGEDGKQIGILALSEALAKARESQLDLIEIAPTAQPPVVRISDYNKFLYQEEKKNKSAKKVKGGDIKGIRLTPFIAQGDLDVRVKRSLGFLSEGNKVRVSVRFTGRQLRKREFGYELLKKFAIPMQGFAQSEGEPKWFGRELVLTFAPVKQVATNNAKTENQEINN